MKRSTVRLIHSIAYRRALVQDLPGLEARLLALLEEGQTLRTRSWIVTRRSEELLITPNDSPPSLRQLQLGIQQE